MSSPLYGVSLFSSLLDSEDGMHMFVQFALKEHYFQGDELNLYNDITDHVQKYKKLPDKDTLDFNFPETPEPPTYYYDKIVHRYLRNVGREYLKAAEYQYNENNMDKFHSLLRELLSKSYLVKNKRRIFDHNVSAGDIVMSEYQKMLLGGAESNVLMGWPSIDKLCGGLSGGDVVSIIGRPGMGKSYMMLYSALTMWDKGFSPIFFSMEMKPLSIMQRLAAMDAKIPITGLKKAELSDVAKGRLVTKLGEDKGRPFWVVDGALSATMDDIEMLSVQLQPDVVFIDGAYLVRLAGKEAQRWERLTVIAEGIKQRIAEDMDLPVVISYQFNRQASKKGGGATLDNIAYTDAIGQLSSIALSIEEDENTETFNSRKITIMKGRDGQTGSFKINWNFDDGPNFMDFSEVVDNTHEW